MLDVTEHTHIASQDANSPQVEKACFIGTNQVGIHGN